MKLKIVKTMKVADKCVSNPHWSFVEVRIVDIEDKHIIETLLKYKLAKEIKKETKIKPFPEGKKMKEVKLNKMKDTPLNKEA